MKSKFNLKLSHKGFILVAIPLICELVFVFILIICLQQAEHAIRREQHAKTVVTESNILLKNIVDSGVALYLYSTTGSSSQLQRYKELSIQIPETIQYLKILLRDSPNPDKAFARIKQIGNRSALLLAQGAEIISDSGAARRIAEDHEHLEQLLSELNSELRAFVKEQEKAEQIDPQAESRSRTLVVSCLFIGISLNIILAIALVIYFNRGTTVRLSVLMDNTKRLADRQILLNPIDGNDEIAHLDHVFHEMANNLAETARRKQEIVSMVSHDLRTPLTSIQASLTLLSEGVFGKLSEKVKDELESTELNTERLIRLIEDLLDYEKLESGQLKIVPEICRLQSLLNKAWEAVRNLAELKKIELVYEDKNNSINTTDILVYVDPFRIIQILVNLFSNSIKFSELDKKIRLCVFDVENNMVEIQIIDEGRGIPQEYLPKLFNRFQQIEIEDAKMLKGTGLGLSICKSLIELHGGSIGVKNNITKGCTFWFRIAKADQSDLI